MQADQRGANGPFRATIDASERRRFHDRTDAGRQLALRLVDFRAEQPLVLALPRGGVPVAFAIARMLDAPLDVLPVRKIGVPGHRELGVGALALGGAAVLNAGLIRDLGIAQSDLEQVMAEERIELERQRQRFRGDRPVPDLHGQTAILVDDGLATGVSALAAIGAVRAMGARRIVLAVPVCAPQAADELPTEVDALVCVTCPPDFYAVGRWYEQFDQTTDEEVLDLLERNRREQAAGRGQMPASRGAGP